MFRSHPIFGVSALIGSSYLFALDGKPAMHLASVRQVFTHIPTGSPWYCFAPTDSHRPPRARTGALAVQRVGVSVPAGARHRGAVRTWLRMGSAGGRGVQAPGLARCGRSGQGASAWPGPGAKGLPAVGACGGTSGSFGEGAAAAEVGREG